VTGNCRTEAEQLVASAEGVEEGTSNPDQGDSGCHPPHGPEPSVCIGGSGANNTVTGVEKAEMFGQCARDNEMKDLLNPVSNEPFVDTSRIPSAAGRGVRGHSGFQAGADTCTAIDAGELGLRVQ
jgi:hypothetical protein